MQIGTILLMWILSLGIVGGGDGDEDTPVLVAQPTAGAIALDGRLDEPDWTQATLATTFTQFEPVEGGQPSQRTEVRILYGESAVYIGAMLYDTDPDAIVRALGRRDDYNAADWFTIYIDSHFDRKTAYTFAVNAAGIQLDGIQTNDFDASWDAVWQSSARVTAHGWAVEMRIPYSMLRFSEVDVQTWGVNFRRTIQRTGEVLDWVMIPRTERESGVVARYGRLEGLHDLQPRRNIQVTPYTVTRMQLEEGTPGERLTSRDLNLGGDLKVGLSSSMTLDATFNPDFGQVDSDPAELNLSAFESFFAERRPFFVEGAQIFSFGSGGRDGSLLYTRRIGARAPIIGAAKLSGRTENGFSVGVLGATTGESFDPDYYYGVTRLRQEIGKYSSVGGMVTAYQRRVAARDPLQSYAGGVDWQLRFADNLFNFSGTTTLSHRASSGDEPTTTTGMAGQAQLNKIQGVWQYGVTYELYDDQYDANDLGRTRRNDFMRMRLRANHQLNRGAAFGPFRRADVQAISWQLYSYRERLDMGLGFRLSSDWELQGFQKIDVSYTADYLRGGYDLFETRGLGPWALPRKHSFRVEFETDSRRAWQLEPNARYERIGERGRQVSLGLSGTWNMGTRLSLASEVNVNRSANQLAWAANESFRHDGQGWTIGQESTSPDGAAEEGYVAVTGADVLDTIVAERTPYGDTDAFFLPVFGERDTRSVDVSLRSNITFTPNLSLQLYTQLFAARGSYDTFQILQDRDTLTPFDAYPKHHDFAFSNFQSNVVLRWEYRPGSTLFLVWTQSRRAETDRDPFDLTNRSQYRAGTLDQFGDTFGLYPTNVFLIKLNYTFLR